MKPNVRYSFDIKFEEQLVRALKGHAPWKNKMPQASKADWRNDPVSDGQKWRLNNLGIKIPATKGEASDLITAALRK